MGERLNERRLMWGGIMMNGNDFCTSRHDLLQVWMDEEAVIEDA
jgi:hypothetical protein